jgi:hypothetical protein
MIEPLIEDKKRTYDECLMTKNAEDREPYKRANKIVEKRVKERKNRMWEMKCRKVNSIVGGSRSTEI